MRLTLEEVKRFANGGQVEIVNRDTETHRACHLIAEIKSMSLRNHQAEIIFEWLASTSGADPQKWIKKTDTIQHYRVNLTLYSRCKDVSKDVRDNGRIHIESAVKKETIIFYPPDGGKLKRSEVEGLQPTQK